MTEAASLPTDAQPARHDQHQDRDGERLLGLFGRAVPDGLTVDQRFAVVPEWMIDSTVSDTAFRLYAVLARYGNTSGVRMPGRTLLARRLHRSVDTVDRALKELVEAGILTVERRSDAVLNLTNRYHLRTLDPSPEEPGGSRAFAATPPPEVQVNGVGSRSGAATPGRSGAARGAAGVRPNPDTPTDTPPPTTRARQFLPATSAAVTSPATGVERRGGGRHVQLLSACGIEDLDDFASVLRRLRKDLNQPSVRWSAPCLAAAVQFAVKIRGWPAEHARQALLLVAADPATRSPMRLAEAGPWWDQANQATLGRTAQEQDELDGLEATLAESDDRALLQQQARRQLAAYGEPVTRLTVARRACRLLEHQISGLSDPAQARSR